LFSDVQDDISSACDYATQEELDAAFAAWIAGFTYGGGCDPQANDLSGYSAPELCAGGSVEVTLNVTDLCESGSDTATFSVTGDNTPPTIYEVPDDYEICNGLAPESITLNWDDNCGESGEVTAYKTLKESDSCSRTYEYVFSATDRCDNNTTENVLITEKWDQWQNCETAFGVFTDDGSTVGDDSRCFREDGFSRWGWTNSISPNAPGSPYTLQLYAGAGKCDLSKGTHVGTATVDYSGGYVTVNYNITTPGYAMSEAHVYIGCEPYPTKNGVNTVAPGQYNFNPGGLDHVYNYQVVPIEASGELYVIVHAVVCE
jgi:hypothetical protein